MEVLLHNRQRHIDRREVVGEHDDCEPHRQQGEPGGAGNRAVGASFDGWSLSGAEVGTREMDRWSSKFDE
jgi:hypothetical protein